MKISSVEQATEEPPMQGVAAVAGGSRLVTIDGEDGLEYIARSPAPEHGGFHETTVAIAKGAIAEIARLRGIIARNAMQRLDDTKFHITAEDISSSIEIAADYRERHANNKVTNTPAK